jgi:DNA-binding transcriptional ArsR family regulator
MNISEMRSRAAEAERFLKSIGNGHRLLILCSLAEGERSVGELERLLDMRQPHLSQHLTRLRGDGLVKTRRASRTVFYSLGSEPVERVIGLLYDLFCTKGEAPIPEAKSALPAET